ncbi:MAG: histidine phosphatase family protein [Alphaproteobacteria bacterium]|nr:histidine phosphatase family protein [Alphaproteobacteria bacterium]
MKQLLLLRHAKSSWDEADQTDHARPLNARGRRNAVQIGQAMRALGLAPDYVLVSTARRTQETLAALEPLPDAPVILPEDGLYLADAEQLLDAIRAVPETVRSVMVIAHNPGLHDLALSLTGPAAMARGNAHAMRLAEKYPTGALAEFAIAGSWAGLGPGVARLVRFIVPRDLPETAG